MSKCDVDSILKNGVVTIDDKAMNDLTLSGDLHLVNKKSVPEPDLDQLNYIASPFPIPPLSCPNDDNISSGMVFAKMMGIRHVRGWK
jgi:hypothetical protein